MDSVLLFLRHKLWKIAIVGTSKDTLKCCEMMKDLFGITAPNESGEKTNDLGEGHVQYEPIKPSEESTPVFDQNNLRASAPPQGPIQLCSNDPLSFVSAPAGFTLHHD